MEFIMALRDLVKDVHTEAEDSPFAKLLMSGSITQDQYAHYLYQQKYIYEALETRADHLGILDEIPHIKRTDKISHDLASLETQTSYGLFPSVLNYVQYVNSLSEDRCWAHIYVRHFGDMYGGAMISKKVPGLGMMYKFKDKEGLKTKVRAILNDDMADEANACFEFAIRLFEELA